MADYYRVKIKELAVLMLPTFLRKPLITALAHAAVHGMFEVYTRFIGWKEQTDYRIAHNGQICHLRAVLNDAFDPERRRIEVKDEGVRRAPNLLYLRVVDMPRLMARRRERPGQLVLNRRGFGGTGDTDFWVELPAGLLTARQEERLTALVNKYKLASKRWTIMYKYN